MKTTFTLLFSLLTITAFAQQNFVPGSYTTLQGEKVEAQINDQNWDRNPSFIEVKVSSGSEVKKLTVKDIQDFSLSTGDKYERHIVDVDKSPVKLNQLLPNDPPLIVRDTVFLRTLVAGNADLYYLKDDVSKDHYYLKTGEDTPLELIYKLTLLQTENGARVARTPIYKGMLSAKLTGCKEVSDRISRVAFKMSAFISIVEEYNACLGGAEKSTYTARQEKVSHSLVALAGGTYNKLTFTGSDFPDLIGKDFNGVSYTVGLSIVSTIPRARGKWAVRNDFIYKPLKADNIYETGRNVGEENYSRVETTFDIGYVGLNTSVRYNLLEAKVKPYLNLGIANNFIISNNSNQESYRRYYTIENTRQEAPLNDYRKHEPAIFIGAGMQIKKILVEAKFEKGTAFSAYAPLGSWRSSFTFQVGYTLK